MVCSNCADKLASRVRTVQLSLVSSLVNRAPALSRAESEHRKLLRLCREGKIPEACDYLVAHIEKVRQDLHALLRRGSSSSKPVKSRA